MADHRSADRDLRALVDWVWCTTCQHTHIPDIPPVTFVCATDCGFGTWDTITAEQHATRQVGHLVYPVHHHIVTDPGPRPELTTDEDGYPAIPDGWDRITLNDLPGFGGQVLCGWDKAGVFHQWAPTEDIVAAMFTSWDDQCLENYRG